MLFVTAGLLLMIAFGLISCRASDNEPLSPERISQLRIDYPAYNENPELVDMKVPTFEEIIKGVDSVIIGRVVRELPPYEVDLSPLLQPELRAKENASGISSKHQFHQVEIEVVRHISGKPVNKVIPLAYNAMFEGYEPRLKTGMIIVVGIANGSGVHQGKYFFTRFGTYYIVDDEYVLSAVDDAFSQQMNGHKVDRLIEKIKEIRD